MPKRMKLTGAKKDAAIYSICCCVVCLILSFLYMIIQKYAFGNDKPFSIVNL